MKSHVIVPAWLAWHILGQMEKLAENLDIHGRNSSEIFEDGDMGEHYEELRDRIFHIEKKQSEMIKYTRTWAMPNKLTFSIKPIRELVEKYVAKSRIIIDPFANQSKYGTITNDLNPEFDTDYHIDALSFLKKMDTEQADLVLFDPPYSITQAAQCYKDYGKDKLERSVANMGYWADCKNEVARILKPNGVALICGWNTNGLGKNRGFEMVEILIVPHGGSKNDTIVTIERKKPE